jgi:hypothetical protein
MASNSSSGAAVSDDGMGRVKVFTAASLLSVYTSVVTNVYGNVYHLFSDCTTITD